MDLGIKGKKAIVCASSKGLGKACAKSLIMEGVDVIINSRSQENLEKTLNELNYFEKFVVGHQKKMQNKNIIFS